MALSCMTYPWFVEGFDPRFRRRRRLLSWVEQAAGREVLDLATVWRDGAILCDVIHRSCPSACLGWEESESNNSFRHAQALAYRCLQLDPAFSEEELNHKEMTPCIEKRLFRYVQAIKLAVSKRHFTRSLDEESEGEALIAEEYIARGMGLIMASRKQPAIFYIYSRDGSGLMDIHIEIRGPGDDFGSALVTDTESYDNPSKCSIPVEYRLTKEYLRVSYRPQSVGHHELSVSRHGYIVPGSPFLITVDEITERQPHKRFNSIEWYTEDEERRQLELQEKKNNAKVKYRIVDFVTEKMLLTEDGKLLKIPEGTQEGTTPPPTESPSPCLTRLSPLEFSPSVSPSPTPSCDSRSSSSRSRRTISPRLKKRNRKSSPIDVKSDAMKYVIVKPKPSRAKRVSDAASQASLELHPNVFMERCKRIVTVCDYLLKHCPQRKSLEIISGAGCILEASQHGLGPCPTKITSTELPEVNDDDDEVFEPSPTPSPTVNTLTCPGRCSSVSLSFVGNELVSSNEYVDRNEEDPALLRVRDVQDNHSASEARKSFRTEGNTKSSRRRSSFSSIGSINDYNEDCCQEINREDIQKEDGIINTIDFIGQDNEAVKSDTRIENCEESQDVIKGVSNDHEHTTNMKQAVAMGKKEETKVLDKQCDDIQETEFQEFESTNRPLSSCLDSDNQNEEVETKAEVKITPIKNIDNTKIDCKIPLKSPLKGSLVNKIIAHFEESLSNNTRKNKEQFSPEQTFTNYDETYNKANMLQKKINAFNLNNKNEHENNQNEKEVLTYSLKSMNSNSKPKEEIIHKIRMFEKVCQENELENIKHSKQKCEPSKQVLKNCIFRAEPALVVSKHFAELREITIKKDDHEEGVYFDFHTKDLNDESKIENKETKVEKSNTGASKVNFEETKINDDDFSYESNKGTYEFISQDNSQKELVIRLEPSELSKKVENDRISSEREFSSDTLNSESVVLKDANPKHFDNLLKYKTVMTIPDIEVPKDPDKLVEGVKEVITYENGTLHSENVFEAQSADKSESNIITKLFSSILSENKTTHEEPFAEINTVGTQVSCMIEDQSFEPTLQHNLERNLEKEVEHEMLTNPVPIDCKLSSTSPISLREGNSVSSQSGSHQKTTELITVIQNVTDNVSIDQYTKDQCSNEENDNCSKETTKTNDHTERNDEVMSNYAKDKACSSNTTNNVHLESITDNVIPEQDTKDQCSKEENENRSKETTKTNDHAERNEVMDNYTKDKACSSITTNNLELNKSITDNVTLEQDTKDQCSNEINENCSKETTKTNDHIEINEVMDNHRNDNARSSIATDNVHLHEFTLQNDDESTLPVNRCIEGNILNGIPLKETGSDLNSVQNRSKSPTEEIKQPFEEDTGEEHSKKEFQNVYDNLEISSNLLIEANMSNELKIETTNADKTIAEVQSFTLAENDQYDSTIKAVTEPMINYENSSEVAVMENISNHVPVDDLAPKKSIDITKTQGTKPPSSDDIESVSKSGNTESKENMLSEETNTSVRYDAELTRNNVSNAFNDFEANSASEKNGKYHANKHTLDDSKTVVSTINVLEKYLENTYADDTETDMDSNVNYDENPTNKSLNISETLITDSNSVLDENRISIDPVKYSDLTNSVAEKCKFFEKAFLDFGLVEPSHRPTLCNKEINKVGASSVEAFTSNESRKENVTERTFNNETPNATLVLESSLVPMKVKDIPSNIESQLDIILPVSNLVQCQTLKETLNNFTDVPEVVTDHDVDFNIAGDVIFDKSEKFSSETSVEKDETIRAEQDDKEKVEVGVSEHDDSTKEQIGDKNKASTLSSLNTDTTLLEQGEIIVTNSDHADSVNEEKFVTETIACHSQTHESYDVISTTEDIFTETVDNTEEFKTLNIDNSKENTTTDASYCSDKIENCMNIDESGFHEMATECVTNITDPLDRDSKINSENTDLNLEVENKEDSFNEKSIDNRVLSVDTLSFSPESASNANVVTFHVEDMPIEEGTDVVLRDTETTEQEVIVDDSVLPIEASILENDTFENIVETKPLSSSSYTITSNYTVGLESDFEQTIEARSNKDEPVANIGIFNSNETKSITDNVSEQDCTENSALVNIRIDPLSEHSLTDTDNVINPTYTSLEQIENIGDVDFKTSEDRNKIFLKSDETNKPPFNGIKSQDQTICNEVIEENSLKEISINDLINVQPLCENAYPTKDLNSTQASIVVEDGNTFNSSFSCDAETHAKNLGNTLSITEVNNSDQLQPIVSSNILEAFTTSSLSDDNTNAKHVNVAVQEENESIAAIDSYTTLISSNLFGSHEDYMLQKAEVNTKEISFEKVTNAEKNFIEQQTNNDINVATEETSPKDISVSGILAKFLTSEKVLIDAVDIEKDEVNKVEILTEPESSDDLVQKGLDDSVSTLDNINSNIEELVKSLTVSDDSDIGTPLTYTRDEEDNLSKTLVNIKCIAIFCNESCNANKEFGSITEQEHLESPADIELTETYNAEHQDAVTKSSVFENVSQIIEDPKSNLQPNLSPQTHAAEGIVVRPNDIPFCVGSNDIPTNDNIAKTIEVSKENPTKTVENNEDDLTSNTDKSNGEAVGSILIHEVPKEAIPQNDSFLKSPTEILDVVTFSEEAINQDTTVKATYNTQTTICLDEDKRIDKNEPELHSINNGNNLENQDTEREEELICSKVVETLERNEIETFKSNDEQSSGQIDDVNTINCNFNQYDNINIHKYIGADSNTSSTSDSNTQESGSIQIALNSTKNSSNTFDDEKTDNAETVLFEAPVLDSTETEVAKITVFERTIPTGRIIEPKLLITDKVLTDVCPKAEDYAYDLDKNESTETFLKDNITEISIIDKDPSTIATTSPSNLSSIAPMDAFTEQNVLVKSSVDNLDKSIAAVQASFQSPVEESSVTTTNPKNIENLAIQTEYENLVKPISETKSFVSERKSIDFESDLKQESLLKMVSTSSLDDDDDAGSENNCAENYVGQRSKVSDTLPGDVISCAIEENFEVETSVRSSSLELKAEPDFEIVSLINEPAKTNALVSNEDGNDTVEEPLNLFDKEILICKKTEEMSQTVQISTHCSIEDSLSFDNSKDDTYLVKLETKTEHSINKSKESYTDSTSIGNLTTNEILVLDYFERQNNNVNETFNETEAPNTHDGEVTDYQGPQLSNHSKETSLHMEETVRDLDFSFGNDELKLGTDNTGVSHIRPSTNVCLEHEFVVEVISNCTEKDATVFDSATEFYQHSKPEVDHKSLCPTSGDTSEEEHMILPSENNIENSQHPEHLLKLEDELTERNILNEKIENADYYESNLEVQEEIAQNLTEHIYEAEIMATLPLEKEPYEVLNESLLEKVELNTFVHGKSLQHNVVQNCNSSATAIAKNSKEEEIAGGNVMEDSKSVTAELCSTTQNNQLTENVSGMEILSNVTNSINKLTIEYEVVLTSPVAKEVNSNEHISDIEIILNSNVTPTIQKNNVNNEDIAVPTLVITEENEIDKITMYKLGSDSEYITPHSEKHPSLEQDFEENLKPCDIDEIVINISTEMDFPDEKSGVPQELLGNSLGTVSTNDKYVSEEYESNMIEGVDKDKYEMGTDSSINHNLMDEAENNKARLKSEASEYVTSKNELELETSVKEETIQSIVSEATSGFLPEPEVTDLTLMNNDVNRSSTTYGNLEKEDNDSPTKSKSLVTEQCFTLQKSLNSDIVIASSLNESVIDVQNNHSKDQFSIVNCIDFEFNDNKELGKDHESGSKLEDSTKDSLENSTMEINLTSDEERLNNNESYVSENSFEKQEICLNPTSQSKNFGTEKFDDIMTKTNSESGVECFSSSTFLLEVNIVETEEIIAVQKMSNDKVCNNPENMSGDTIALTSTDNTTPYEQEDNLDVLINDKTTLNFSSNNVRYLEEDTKELCLKNYEKESSVKDQENEHTLTPLSDIDEVTIVKNGEEEETAVLENFETNVLNSLTSNEKKNPIEPIVSQNTSLILQNYLEVGETETRINKQILISQDSLLNTDLDVAEENVFEKVLSQETRTKSATDETKNEGNVSKNLSSTLSEDTLLDRIENLEINTELEVRNLEIDSLNKSTNYDIPPTVAIDAFYTTEALSFSLNDKTNNNLTVSSLIIELDEGNSNEIISGDRSITLALTQESNNEKPKNQHSSTNLMEHEASDNDTRGVAGNEESIKTNLLNIVASECTAATTEEQNEQPVVSYTLSHDVNEELDCPAEIAMNQQEKESRINIHHDMFKSGQNLAMNQRSATCEEMLQTEDVQRPQDERRNTTETNVRDETLYVQNIASHITSNEETTFYSSLDESLEIGQEQHLKEAIFRKTKFELDPHSKFYDGKQDIENTSEILIEEDSVENGVVMNNTVNSEGIAANNVLDSPINEVITHGLEYEVREKNIIELSPCKATDHCDKSAFRDIFEVSVQSETTDLAIKSTDVAFLTRDGENVTQIHIPGKMEQNDQNILKVCIPAPIQEKSYDISTGTESIEKVPQENSFSGSGLYGEIFNTTIEKVDKGLVSESSTTIETRAINDSENKISELQATLNIFVGDTSKKDLDQACSLSLNNKTLGNPNNLPRASEGIKVETSQEISIEVGEPEDIANSEETILVNDKIKSSETDDKQSGKVQTSAFQTDEKELADEEYYTEPDINQAPALNYEVDSSAFAARDLYLELVNRINLPNQVNIETTSPVCGTDAVGLVENCNVNNVKSMVDTFNTSCNSFYGGTEINQNLDMNVDSNKANDTDSSKEKVTNEKPTFSSDENNEFLNEGKEIEESNVKNANIVHKIKQFIFPDTGKYVVNSEQEQIYYKTCENTDNTCLLVSHNKSINDFQEQIREESLSPELEMLSSTKLNKRQFSFTTDTSTVQKMRQRFEKTEIEMSFCEEELDDSTTPPHLNKGHTNKWIFGGSSDDKNPVSNNLKETKTKENYKENKNLSYIWETTEADSSQTDVEQDKSDNSCKKSIFGNGDEILSSHEVTNQRFSQNPFFNPQIDEINQSLSLESEMLNKNLITVERELCDVFGLEREQIDKNLKIEINDEEYPIDGPFINLQIPKKSPSNNLIVDDDQSEVLSIDGETIDLKIQQEISEIDALPDPENEESEKHEKKIIHVNPVNFSFDQTDIESCDLEHENLDDQILEEISKVDALISTDTSGSFQKELSSDSVCVVKPRLISAGINFNKKSSLIEDEELDEETQRELLEIDVMDEEFIDESRQEPVENSRSAIGFFKENKEILSDISPFMINENSTVDCPRIVVPPIEVEYEAFPSSEDAMGGFNCQEYGSGEEMVDINSCLGNKESLQHYMYNYEFFSNSTNAGESNNTNDSLFLELPCDSLQSSTSGAGESISDRFPSFNDYNLSVSTESDGSDFHMWSSNVEFGDPSDIKAPGEADFDSIISAPSLTEALKKLEAHIQHKGEDFEWLSVRTPSPSLQSLEQYFKDGISCFDTEKFYAEVSGNALPEKCECNEFQNTTSDQAAESVWTTPGEESSSVWTTPGEESSECSYTPGSLEAKNIEAEVQEDAPEDWIISPYQFPRVLYNSTPQMSIIDEEDDQNKSEPNSPLKRYIVSDGSGFTEIEAKVENSKDDKSVNCQSSQAKPTSEVNQILEEFDRLTARASVDEGNIFKDEPIDDLCDNLRTVNVVVKINPSDNDEHNNIQQEACSSKSNIINYSMEFTQKLETENSFLQAEIGISEGKFKNKQQDIYLQESTFGSTSTEFKINEDENLHENKDLLTAVKNSADLQTIDTNLKYSNEKQTVEKENNIKETNIEVQDKLKPFTDGILNPLTEETIDELSVTERKTFWDMKLQKLKEQEGSFVPNSGPKSLSKIKSGTVLELASCFAKNNDIKSLALDLKLKPSLKPSNSFKRDYFEKESKTIMLDTPKENSNVHEAASMKLVSHWKSYWDDIISEKEAKDEFNIKKLKVPSIQISEDDDIIETSAIDCFESSKNVNEDINDFKGAKAYLGNIEESIQHIQLHPSYTNTDKSSISVLKNIKLFNDISSTNVGSNDVSTSKRNADTTNTEVSSHPSNNAKSDFGKEDACLLNPISRSRSYSTGHIDTKFSTSDLEDNPVPKELETKSKEQTCLVDQQNEFRIRFERAKQFFKQLESSEPGDLKNRNYKSMPRMNLVLSNKKVSIDSDSGADIKPQKRRDRYRNRRKRRKDSAKIQSAPASDTETAKRVQPSDSFESFGGSVKSIKVSERFHVKDLFRDVSGKVGLFRGIPNRAAVLASLKSVDGVEVISPYKMDFIDPKSASLSNIPAGFQDEYPYLPTTPANLYRPRSALELNLIPRSQLIGEKKLEN